MTCLSRTSNHGHVKREDGGGYVRIQRPAFPLASGAFEGEPLRRQHGDRPVGAPGTPARAAISCRGGDALSGRQAGVVVLRRYRGTQEHRNRQLTVLLNPHAARSSCSTVEKTHHSLRSDRGRSPWTEFVEDGRWRIVLASGAAIASVGVNCVEFTMSGKNRVRGRLAGRKEVLWA